MIVKLVARLGFRRYPVPLIFLNKALIFISQNTNDFHYTASRDGQFCLFFIRLFRFVNDEKISGNDCFQNNNFENYRFERDENKLWKFLRRNYEIDRSGQRSFSNLDKNDKYGALMKNRIWIYKPRFKRENMLN